MTFFLNFEVVKKLSIYKIEIKKGTKGMPLIIFEIKILRKLTDHLCAKLKKNPVG